MTKNVNNNEMHKLKIVVLLIIFIGVFGCSYNETLYSNLTKSNKSLKFDYDSEIIAKKKNVLIAIDNIEFKKSAMIDSTYIVEQSLPKLYFDWEEYECFVGEDLVNEDIPSFIHDNLTAMINRSAIFLTDYPDSINNSNMKKYMLDITIDTLEVNGKFLFMGEQTHVAYPAVAQCQLTMNLTNNMNLMYTKNIVQKSYTNEKQKKKNQNFKRFNSSDLQEQYATDMVLALSTAIKNSLSEIIHNVNNYLQQNEKDLRTIKEISVLDIRQKQYDQEIKRLPIGFLTFKINENNTINGKLISVDQNNFYVVNDKTLYIIKRKSIISTTDRNLNIVTKDELSKIGFHKINYNKYVKFEEIE